MAITRRTFIQSGLASAALASAGLAREKASRSQRLSGLLYDQRYLEHEIRAQHPESPERLKAIYRKLREVKLLDRLKPVELCENAQRYIQLIHTKKHIAAISAIPVSGSIAELAAAGVLSAVDRVCNNTLDNAFCAVRPPGHHAENTCRPEGFCYYNNVAIAARFAQKKHGIEKVLIIDWDYHHGNGTEQFFYEDPSVLFFSVHDRRAYPGTGDPRKKGAGKGKGFSINVHLGCGARDRDMIEAWEEHLLPAAHAFKPELVLISAGFDSRKGDLLGCFDLTDICFSRMTRMALDLADEYAEGRLVSALEGGYHIDGQAEAVAAHVHALLQR